MLTKEDRIITVTIGWADTGSMPVPRPKSSRTIAREKAKAEEAARLAADADRLQRMVLSSLKPAAGRLWSLDRAALLLIGPAGGIPIPAGAVPILLPLAAGGRHALSERERSALSQLAPRLAVVGLRVDSRKAGARIAKGR